MTHSLKLAGAAALGIVLAASCAQAQTVHHRSRQPAAPGREVTVHARESWLTAGTGASVGSHNGYVLDTFRPPQRDAVQNTFVAGRGLEYLPNQHSLPESNRPLLIVSWPGSGDPFLSLY
jgi:hypothetical protein